MYLSSGLRAALSSLTSRPGSGRSPGLSRRIPGRNVRLAWDVICTGRRKLEEVVAKPDQLSFRPVIVTAKSSESSEQKPSGVAKIVSTTFLEYQEDAMNP